MVVGVGIVVRSSSTSVVVGIAKKRLSLQTPYRVNVPITWILWIWSVAGKVCRSLWKSYMEEWNRIVSFCLSITANSRRWAK